MREADKAGEEPAFAHDTACIDEGARIGGGTRIWHFSHVRGGAVIGAGCNIGQNVYIDQGAILGDNVKVQNNVSIYDGVVLEDDVFCGPSMVFTNVINPRSHRPRKDEFRSTTIRRGATIGANATVICGHEIGRYAFVGAGAVVAGDVPAYALVYGCPASIQGWMCECGEKMHFVEGPEIEGAECEVCGLRYEKKGLQVLPAAAAGGEDDPGRENHVQS